MQNIEKVYLQPSYWGKLTSLHAEFNNLNLDQNPYPLFALQNPECFISKDNSEQYWIENHGDLKISIENETLSKGNQKKINSGDKISFRNPSSETLISFVFSAVENTAKTENQVLFRSEDKHLKLEKDMKTELTCSVCLKYFNQCVSLIPCLHSFCANCILLSLKNSQTCPCCQNTFVEVRRNTGFNSLIEALEEIQDAQRSDQEIQDFNQHMTFVKRFEYANGDIYQGYFKRFKREGKGKLNYSNGDFYQGDFINNLRHGRGRTIFSNGEKHEGIYHKNIRQGHGKYLYQCGDIYEGNFFNDLPNGKGKYTCVNGVKYVFEGEFENGLREGKGTMTWEDGGCFEGSFKNDLKEGIGKNVYPSGDIYHGNYHKDMRDGQGVMQYFRGDIYQGEFKNDFRDGLGKYIFPNGDILQGLFENGQFSGEGKIIYKNGNIYDGLFSEFLEPEGRGTFHYADGSVYEGRLIRGKKEGYGQLTSVKGKISEGVFENDQLISTKK